MVDPAARLLIVSALMAGGGTVFAQAEQTPTEDIAATLALAERGDAKAQRAGARVRDPMRS